MWCRLIAGAEVEEGCDDAFRVALAATKCEERPAGTYVLRNGYSYLRQLQGRNRIGHPVKRNPPDSSVLRTNRFLGGSVFKRLVLDCQAVSSL